MSDITQKQYFAALSTVELYEEFHGDQGMEESESLSTTTSVEPSPDAEIDFVELLSEDLEQNSSSEDHLTCSQIFSRAKKRTIDGQYKPPRREAHHWGGMTGPRRFPGYADFYTGVNVID